ncbi:MAG: hypothetical protein WCV90_08945 [Candidatus Woesearchaeota archaeon]|jgi:hypothetical protein
MSGGRWNYANENEFDELISFHEMLKRSLECLKECLSCVDYVESGDSSKEEMKEEIYNKLLNLGDQTWG